MHGTTMKNKIFFR